MLILFLIISSSYVTYITDKTALISTKVKNFILIEVIREILISKINFRSISFVQL